MNYQTFDEDHKSGRITVAKKENRFVARVNGYDTRTGQPTINDEMLPALASITDLIDKSESHLAGLKALKARYEELNAEEAAAIETAKAAKKAEEANAKKQMEPTE